jgi:hypothetical protein
MSRPDSRGEHLPAQVEFVARRIFIIRGQKVMLDSDLAQLYQVPTKRLNEAVKRNIERFPEDFLFQLTPDETEDLRSQFATSSSTHGGRRFLPYAFTQEGVAMLSSVLRSPRAVQMNILIMRAFVRMRELLAGNKALAAKVEQLDRTQKQHGAILVTLVQDIQKLKHPPVTRVIGFVHPKTRRK